MSTLFVKENIFEETPLGYATKAVNDNVSIPAFQRNYVWSSKPKKILDLLESIYLGFNLGTIVFWESKKTGISRKKQNTLNENIEHDVLEYVVDGQQRTLTLVSLFTDFNIVELDLNSYFIQYNPEKGKLFFEAKKPNPNYPYITFGIFKEKILNKQDGFVDLRIVAKECHESNIKEFTYELEKVFKKNIKSEQIIVGYKLQIGASDLNLAIKQFEKINKTGIALSELDILDSLAYSDNGYEMKLHIDTLRDAKFDGLISSQKDFSSDLKKIIMNSYKLIKNFNEKKIFSLDANAISNFKEGDTEIIEFIFDKLKDCLAELNNLKINDLKDVPYTLNIVTYIFIKWWLLSKFGNDDIPNYSNKDFLMLTMFLTGIQRSYEKSSSAKLISHLNKITKQIETNKSIYFNDGDAHGYGTSLFEISTSDIKSSNYKNISSFEKAIFLYWINNLEVKDYVNQETEMTLMGIFKNKDNLDHIFPKAIYEDKYKREVHSIANISIVTHKTNKEKSKKIPSDFFGQYPFKQNIDMYTSHMIDNVTFDELIDNNFQRFLTRRSTAIANNINNFITHWKNLM